MRMEGLGLTLAAVMGLWLSLGSASALAAGEPHPPAAPASFERSTGVPFSDPNGIAVDEATGDVYVADIGTNTVYKFDASGNPVNFTAGAGSGSNALTGVPAQSAKPAESFSFPAERGTPAAIAIDNSAGAGDPSAGDLYVMDAGHGAVDKFSPSGEYIGQIGGPLSGQGLLGLGVDASGDVRVLTSQPTIDVFDNSRQNVFVKSLQYTSKEEGISRALESGFAVSPSGNMYLLETCGCVEKHGGNTEPLGRVDPGPSDIAVAVDPSTGHLYVDDQSSIAEWDTGGMNGQVIYNGFEDVGTAAPVSTFGSMQLSGLSEQGGIAVDGKSGEIYVSDPGVGKVDVFASDVPAVAAGHASSITKTTTTLHGTIDPHGAAVTSCQFEYEVAPSELRKPVTGYGNSVACDQTPAQIGSGSGPVPVTAEINGLSAGKLYHFRLVAENATGTNSSSGLFAAASPGFGVKTFEVSFLNEDGSPDTQAGSHPFKMVTNIELNTAVIPREKTADSRYVKLPDGSARDIITDLPPGFVGDPNATPVKCTLKQLESQVGENGGGGHCPPESQVGELEIEFGEDTLEPVKEPVYNMVPPPGVAVQIGGSFVVPSVFINAGVRAGGDYPVQASSLDIPEVEPLVTTRLTIFGVVGKIEHGLLEGQVLDTRKAFLTLPTGCHGPLKSKIEADSWQHPGAFVEKEEITRDSVGQPVAITGCSKLQFPPTITVTPDTTDASTSSGLTVGVHVSQKAALNPEGLAESALRDTTVTLPEGVALNPAGADGLEACSEGLAGFTGFEELNKANEEGVMTAKFTPELPQPLLPGSNFCPNGSKIATVKINTPLLPNPLAGTVYLAAQNANPFGSLVALYMFAEDPVSGTILKLTGEVKLSDAGQIVTTFKNTPDLPFEDLELHFFGGERAPLATPSRCGTYTTQATFVPWDGNGPVNTSSSFEIDHGPNGGPCPGQSLPFSPSLTAGTTNIQAGAFTPFTMTMSREDGQQNLQAISLKMPPGLSGLLTGVELCDEARADAGTCGPNSLIGETIVSVGVGNDPFTVTGGKVYLTGPYKGAPFGLSIVNPAKAGPYDLGRVVVRAKIEVDPITTDLTITSDNEGPYKIPTIIDGIPLQIKHVNVTINRSGFTFNPTNCEPLAITGVLDSAEGASEVLSVPFQATNCARLSFKPRFEVSTSGRTSRRNGASLHVKLTYPKAPFGSQANIKSVKVNLPRQLPSRLPTLQKACTVVTFTRNPAACPPGSNVGEGRAVTPLLPVALEGPAYFVSNGGAKFPELVIVLQGYGVTLDLHGETFINEKTNITSSTFHTVPDAPVGTFELTLPQGKNSALAANTNLCALKKNVLVKKRVRVRSKGHTKTVTRKLKKTIAGSLVMPTIFTAQNGVQLKQNTHITVTGCPKAKKAHRKPKKKR
jgi:DNA-binding beta-propeller fold protein YncE